MDYKKELKSGIFVSAIGKYSIYIIQYVLLMILSRILTPAEFGVVSIVNIFLTFFNMLIDMGIGPAIIQNKALTEKQVNGIFSFTILLSILVSIVFALLAKPIAIFFRNDHLIGASVAMAVALFMIGINMVPQAVLLKEKRFREVNTAQIVSSLAGGAVSTVFALTGFSYYALILNTIVKNVIMFVFFYKKANLTLTKTIEKSGLRAIYSFSRNQFLFNFINYFSRNLDTILIGRFLSTKAVGFYDKAYMLSLYPNQMLTHVITPVIQPVMSQYEQQKEVILRTYLLVSKILAFIGMPLTAFLCISAEEVIYLLFGPQWGASATTFQILALSIWIQLIASSAGAIFQSANRTDLLLLSGILSAVLNIAGIIAGVTTGKIEYVAVFLVIAFSLNFIQSNYLLMRKTFQAKQREFYRILRDPFIIALMVLVPLLAIQFFFAEWPLLLLFGVKALTSLIMYLAGLKLTGNFGLLKKILKRGKREAI
ncbi:lipopolysaccharide biosynthesis protein [Bacillaceae bacterium Marseille-Q3522]|nr:lipopolysaccharide biosynthesis protein [Bacillaceae bacterium Marseille-Q3522]